MTGKNKKVNDFEYINEVMGFKVDYSENKLVCVTNGKTVVRITQIKAHSKVKRGKWNYCTKKVYKQYIESLPRRSKIPKPIFKNKKTGAKLNMFVINPKKD